MTSSNNSWPLDDPDHLADAIRQHGTSDNELEELTSALIHLSNWHAPVPAARDTLELVNQLLPYVGTPSHVRRVLQNRSRNRLSEFVMILNLVRTQINILRPSFWLVSAFVVIFGGLLVFGVANVNQSFILQVIGPLLSYLGTASIFRGTGLHMLEFELACPPSPRQLTLVRLIVILSYDIGLGLVLTLLLWSYSGLGFWIITLHWLAPLLLGTGLTLLLSLRIPVHQAAAVSYVGWLGILVLTLISQAGPYNTIDAFSGMIELGFGLTGLAIIGGVIFSLPHKVSNLLPRQ